MSTPARKLTSTHTGVLSGPSDAGVFKTPKALDRRGNFYTSTGVATWRQVYTMRNAVRARGVRAKVG